MGGIASQITSLAIVYSAIYSGTDQRKHQSSGSLAFVRGIHRRPVNSPHKWPVTQKMFPFDDVIMIEGNGLSVNIKKTKFLFSSVGLDVLKKSGKYSYAVCSSAWWSHQMCVSCEQMMMSWYWNISCNTDRSSIGDQLSWDHLIFNMRIPVLVRWHLYIDMGPLGTLMSLLSVCRSCWKQLGCQWLEMPWCSCDISVINTSCHLIHWELTSDSLYKKVGTGLSLLSVPTTY